MAGGAEAAPLGPGSEPLALRASDGVALRAALRVPPEGAPRGLLALLHGRTEFLEKHAPVAAALAARGFAVASTDWRGQGGSARALRDGRRGHVTDFDAYRRDLAALLAAPAAAAVPGPRVMLAHSMGGAVGLGALARGVGDFRAAIFSAPMWELAIGPVSEAAARALSRAAVALGLGGRYVPGARPDVPYALRGFADNALTADPDRFAEIAAVTRQAGDRALAGPTLGWLNAAFAEIDALADLRCPAPALVFVGSDEAVVSPGAIAARARADGMTHVVVPGGRHEVFFETPPRRAQVWAAIDRFLAEQGL